MCFTVKYALSKDVLIMEDLFGTDEMALAKLEDGAKKDTHLNLLWERMNGNVSYKNDESDYETVVRCKSRIVDPKFLASDGTLQKLSDTSSEWKSAVVEGLRPKTYYLKFLD